MKELNVVRTIVKLAALALLCASTAMGCESASDTANADDAVGGSGGGNTTTGSATSTDSTSSTSSTSSTEDDEKALGCDEQVETVSAGRLVKSSKYSMVYSFGPVIPYHGKGKSDLYTQGGARCDDGDVIVK